LEEHIERGEHSSLQEKHRALIRLLSEEDATWDEPENAKFAEYRILEEQVLTKIKAWEAMRPEPVERDIPESAGRSPRILKPVNITSRDQFRSIISQAISRLSNLQRGSSVIVSEDEILDEMARVLPALLLDPQIVNEFYRDYTPRREGLFSEPWELHKGLHNRAVAAVEDKDREEWIAIAHAIANSGWRSYAA